jgi:hypothetical protein
MTSTMIRTMLGASAMAAATALTPAAPAAAATTGPSVAPRPVVSGVASARRTDLTLTYMADAGYAAAVKLRCDPVGGAHPAAARACGELRQVGGNPGLLRPARTMCMLIYAPVTAKINGTWKGHQISWTRTYGNTCEMSRATGVLFRF